MRRPVVPIEMARDILQLADAASAFIDGVRNEELKQAAELLYGWNTKSPALRSFPIALSASFRRPTHFRHLRSPSRIRVANDQYVDASITQ
ncbi:hypothetical protein [Bradyrhizobium stylosanthis]|uniref:hypothetical protein n=1 Tax=Bradyrhizobium stylosanthis TaxID=1803665 RepID=UPI001FD8B375|nr:hypothetical protein [Bradyrhizobium stylosanthis]